MNERNDKFEQVLGAVKGEDGIKSSLLAGNDAPLKIVIGAAREEIICREKYLIDTLTRIGRLTRRVDWITSTDIADDVREINHICESITGKEF